MFETIRSVENEISTAFKIPESAGWGIFEVGAVVINIVIGVSFSFSIIGLAMSMVLYVLSAGNPDSTNKAWNAFIYSFIAACLTVGLIFIRTAIYKVIGAEDPFAGPQGP